MIYTSKNILLVSGSGQNVGKTSFIRRVIARNAGCKLVAIKITHHFYEPTSGLLPIKVTDNYQIYQETNGSSTKDSSLFLQAGAEKVFYIQTTEAYIEEAFLLTTRLLNPEHPIIVESGALRKILKPSLYLFIRKNYEDIKPSAVEIQELADIIVYSDSGQFSIDPSTIIYDQKWKIETDDNT